MGSLSANSHTTGYAGVNWSLNSMSERRRYNGSSLGKSTWKVHVEGKIAAYFYAAVEAQDLESRRKILYLFGTCLLPLFIHSSTATIVITSSQLCTFVYHVVRLKCFFIRLSLFFFSLLLLICVFHIVSPTDLRCC